MNRYHIFYSIFLTIAVLVTFSCFTGCDSARIRPNIIFLLTDDQRWDQFFVEVEKLADLPADQRAQSLTGRVTDHITLEVDCSGFFIAG